MARKKKINYESFKLDKDSVMHDAIIRCYREMYKRAQPSADFDKLMKKYNEDIKSGMDPHDATFYENYYLSHREFCYIVDKYLDAYRFDTVWDDHVQLLMDEVNKGYSVDKYGIPKWHKYNFETRMQYYLDNSKLFKYIDKHHNDKSWLGNIFKSIVKFTQDKNWFPSDYHRMRHHEDRPNLEKQIKRLLKFDFTGLLSKKLSKFFSDFLENRKWYYRFNMDENQFRGNTALGGSPTSNPNTVIEYWKNQGVELTIDERNYDEDYFWCEENGCLDDYWEGKKTEEVPEVGSTDKVSNESTYGSQDFSDPGWDGHTPDSVGESMRHIMT